MVMSQMQIAGVKPDSETFSYLILNCESEENIAKVCHVPDHLLLPLSLFMLWFVERHKSWFWRTLSKLSSTRSIPSAHLSISVVNQNFF